MRCRRLLVCTLFKHQEPRLRPPKSSFPASPLSDATDYPSNLSRSSLAAGLLLAFVALFAPAAQAQTTDPILSTTITVGEPPEEVGGDYRGYNDDHDVGSIDNNEFSYSDTDNRVRAISGDPRAVQIYLVEPLAPENFQELVLEFAGEEFPFADALRYYTDLFIWDQSWLSENAPSLSSDCFATTLPLGGTAGVCLRTTGQTCPPTASSASQICPAPASAQASAEPEIVFVPLIARFRDVPAEHDGSTAFTLHIAFNEPIRTTQAAIQQALTVTHGTVTSARQVDGRRNLWEITVTPNSNGDVNISLPSTTSCVAGAVCTADGRTLSRSVAVSVPRAPLRVRFESLPAGHDGSTAFAVQLAFSEPIERTEAEEIQHTLAVIGGAVTSARRVNGSSDLWETTIQPNPNDVRIALPPTPSCDADNAICTADGRMLSQGVAASVVYRVPLTVRFESLPTGHDGTTEFAVQLAFNQPIWLTEAVMRTQALTVTGGRVTSARRVDGRSDRWEIAIQPNPNDVGISLLPTTSCNTNGAVCTQDGHALSNGLSTTVTGPAAKPVAALQTFALYANYPNPFNAETQMTYALPVAGAVELAIYNVRGQRVRTLVQGVQAAGRYQIVWDGRNDTGAGLASGVYLSRLASTQGVRVRRLLLIK